MFHLTASGTAGRACAGSMNEHVAAVGCSVATVLLCGMLAKPAAAQGAPVTAVLDTLSSVHPFGEVAIAPDARRVVYGSVVTGKRAGAEVDVSALWIAKASDGSGAARLTACPGSVCDEHSAAWSPDGTQVAFVTTDAKEQTQIAIATASDRNVKIITRAHGPLDTPRWSSDGSRIAFLYSEGAPKTPGPLNPLARDAGVLSSTVYEQRLALISAHGGNATLLGPADLNIYEYDSSPDGKRFAVTAARGSGDDNWWIAELDLLDAQSGALTTLVRPHLQIASPRWSGDGTRIAYIGGLMSDQGITGGDIYVVPAAGGGHHVDVAPGDALVTHEAADVRDARAVPRPARRGDLQMRSYESGQRAALRIEQVEFGDPPVVITGAARGRDRETLAVGRPIVFVDVQIGRAEQCCVPAVRGNQRQPLLVHGRGQHACVARERIEGAWRLGCTLGVQKSNATAVGRPAGCVQRAVGAGDDLHVAIAGGGDCNLRLLLRVSRDERDLRPVGRPGGAVLVTNRPRATRQASHAGSVVPLADPERRHLDLGPGTLAGNHAAVDHASCVRRDCDLAKGMHGTERIQHRRNRRPLRCRRFREHAAKEYGCHAATHGSHVFIHRASTGAPGRP